MVLLIAMCVVVVVVVVMVLVVKGLQLLLLENGNVLEAQHLSERLQRTSATGWTPVAPALAGSLWRQHWLEACGATHSLLAGPAAPAPAGQVFAEAAAGLGVEVEVAGIRAPAVRAVPPLVNILGQGGPGLLR